jgi:hypothetical protein
MSGTGSARIHSVGEKEISMRSLKRVFGMVVLASVVSASIAPAQSGVGVGYTDVGPVIGLGGIGGASISLGGRFEKVIRALPDMGDGLLGIQVSADWWSWDYNYFGGNNANVSYIPIGVTANYHFRTENRKLDPFVGAGLGYQIVSASCVINGIDYCGSYSSEIYFIAKAGLRYFTSESLAFYGDVGAGAATLNLGVMFRMSGGS